MRLKNEGVDVKKIEGEKDMTFSFLNSEVSPCCGEEALKSSRSLETETEVFENIQHLAG